MSSNTKYLVTFEYRYHFLNGEGEERYHNNDIITVGIYDTVDIAILEGNKALDLLPDELFVKDRFSKNYLFGTPRTLVANLSSRCGVQFFAKISTLKFEDVVEKTDNILKLAKEYRLNKSQE